MQVSAPPARWPGTIAALTLVGAFIVLLAGPMINFGVLPWQAGLAGFAISALLCAIGVVMLVVALVRRRGSALVRVALIAGLFGAGIPGWLLWQARAAPAIHDISTDLISPPAFRAITPELRGMNSNPVEYDPADAAVQQAAYPLVRPVVLALPAAEAFARAEAAARAMGWLVVAADPLTMQIEATDTVPWWGFKDDVVIHLSADAIGTRIDVRSKSRVGRGDLGVNAARITRYLEQVSRG